MIPLFNNLIDLLTAFPNEQACMKHLEQLRWPNGKIVSPFDPSSAVYRCKNGRFKCKTTRKYFNARKGTIFEDTKIPLQKWFAALFLFSAHKKGISSHQLARDLNVTQKTAWFMLGRLRYAFDHPNFKKQLEGTVEADETFIGGKNKNRHYNKRVKGNQGRAFIDKTPVLGLLQRGGHIVCYKVPDTKLKSIQPLVFATVKPGSVLNSDEWHAYQGLGATYDHRVVDHGRYEYVRGENYTNTVEGFWSFLKRGLNGIYHQVSRTHLDRYLVEFTFRYNTRKEDESRRFTMVLENALTKRLTYDNLINGTVNLN